MNKLLSTALISVFVATTSASIASAQTAPPPDSRSGISHGKRFAERAFARPGERVEARLAYVKTALKIADAQQPQWDAYAQLVRKNAQDMDQRFQARRSGAPTRAQRQRLNAIERLERAQSFHAAAITRLNQLLAVEKPLYAALSPEQQKVADVVLNPRFQSKRGPSMGGRGGHRRG
jgi:protein CpxP